MRAHNAVVTKSVATTTERLPSMHPVLPPLLRLKNIIAPDGPLPVGKSTWWAGVKSGRYPKPVKLGPKTTAWSVDDINDLIARAQRGEVI